jgi:hypothetical protein
MLIALGIEGIGLDDIGARLQVFPVDAFDDRRLGQDKAGRYCPSGRKASL